MHTSTLPSKSSTPEGLVRPAFVLFALLSLITGLVYPLVVTGIAQLAFTQAANGSLIVRDGKTLGSHLIGQSFADPKNFWSRPSATAPMGYNAGASGGSNIGPLNPALTDAVKARIEALRAADPGNTAPVPVDLVTTSASGLDPHVSRAAADYQVARVARAAHPSRKCARWSNATPRALGSASSANRASTCWNSIWIWTRCAERVRRCPDE